MRKKRTKAQRCRVQRARVQRLGDGRDANTKTDVVAMVIGIEVEARGATCEALKVAEGTAAQDTAPRV